MNWNKLLVITSGLVILAALVLHQGHVAVPGSGEDALLTGTAMSVPADADEQSTHSGDSTFEGECTKAFGSDPTATPEGRQCLEAAAAARIAQNDPEN